MELLISQLAYYYTFGQLELYVFDTTQYVLNDIYSTSMIIIIILGSTIAWHLAFKLAKLFI